MAQIAIKQAIEFSFSPPVVWFLVRVCARRCPPAKRSRSRLHKLKGTGKPLEAAAREAFPAALPNVRRYWHCTSQSQAGHQMTTTRRSADSALQTASFGRQASDTQLQTASFGHQAARTTSDHTAIYRRQATTQPLWLIRGPQINILTGSNWRVNEWT